MNIITITRPENPTNLGDLFGIFFEDLNHAADGGLYPEQIRNRSFEFDPIDRNTYHHLMCWEKVERSGKVELSILDQGAYTENNPHYLKINIIEPGVVGVQNIGFEPGLNFIGGDTYIITAILKRDTDFDAPVHLALTDKEGNEYVDQDLLLTSSWEKYTFELTAPTTDHEGRFELIVSGSGAVYADFLSVFPKKTFKNRPNGMRVDLAEKLAALKPKFMRFPGGCLVHDGSLNPDDRNSMYRWKNTIGPVEERPARRNNWGYNQTLGIGYFEYFQFCEDIGTKPLPVLPGGCDPHHHRYTPTEEIGPWIQDALDLIDFANGDETTEWGKKRIELGHPNPFGLEYLAIGNEEVSEPFYNLYPLFVEAIKAKHPEIKLIGSASPFAAGGEYDRGWKATAATDSDLIDEHYYMAPEWFFANHHRYDNFPTKPQVFLGEYASWGNTWYNCLAEGSYMVGLQNNAGKVGLACYAPLFCNVNYRNWSPDMIWFDNHRSYASANYYVQKLFMHHQGDTLLQTTSHFEDSPVVVDQFPTHIPGEIRFLSVENEVKYENICLKDLSENRKVQSTPFIALNQEANTYSFATIDSNHYELTFEVTELTGTKGFQIEFGRQDDQNFIRFEIGGWQNLDSAVSRFSNGRHSCIMQNEFSVEPNRTYEMRLVVNGRHITTYIDGVKYQDVEDFPTVIEPLYVTASETDNDVILKIVNATKEEKDVEINLGEILSDSYDSPYQVTLYQMSGFDLDAANSFEEPELVSDVSSKMTMVGSNFSTSFPMESITVMRIKK